METLFPDDRGEPCDRNDPCVWIVRDRLEFYPCDRDDRKSHLTRLHFLMETSSNDPYVRSDMTYPMMYLIVVACVPKWRQTTPLTPLRSWKYDCIYNTFSKDYENRRTRENAWAKIAEKFGLTSRDA